MNTTLKTLIAGAVALVSMAASAQHVAPMDTREIDARQARQEMRIERGFERGDLTRREVRLLRQGQREIARAEWEAKADGHLTRHELRHLHGLLDQADAQIRQFRNDVDGRGGYGAYSGYGHHSGYDPRDDRGHIDGRDGRDRREF